MTCVFVTLFSSLLLIPIHYVTNVLQHVAPSAQCKVLGLILLHSKIIILYNLSPTHCIR